MAETGLVRRGAIVDVIVRNDESVVLTERTCVRLTALATEIFVMLDQPQTLQAIADHLEATFGAPPGSTTEEALDAILGELAALGVVEIPASDREGPVDPEAGQVTASSVRPTS